MAGQKPAIFIQCMFEQLFRDQIHRSGLTALIHFQFKLQLVAFFQPAHARAFYGRDMDESIGLAVIALDEAKALGTIEEFYSASSLFTGQFSARGATTVIAATTSSRYFDKVALDLNVRSRNFSAAVNQRKPQGLAFGQALQARSLNLADVDKNVFATTVLNDEAKTFLRIKKFDGSGAFTDNLVRHAAASPGGA